MATKISLYFTPRDLDVLTVLSRIPLTAEQLLKLSQTWKRPFTQVRLVRRRLQRLGDQGRVHCWRYASTGTSAAPKYYKLTRLGFRTLCEQGIHSETPKDAFFRELSISLHNHTCKLADVIVHTIVSAHRRGITFTEFHRENEFIVEADRRRTQPDCRFTLNTPSGESYTYCVEIDNGTEPLQRFKSDDESCERKIAIYDHDRATSDPYFVLFFAPSWQRAHRILEIAAARASEPRRLFVCATTIDAFLQENNPIFTNTFQTHQGKGFAFLLPPANATKVPTQPLASSFAMC